MQPFTFIHAADLHIDSPFVGVTAAESAPEGLGEALHASTFQAFDRLIQTTLEQQADFLLVGGDVYDGQDRSLRAQLRFRDGLARLTEAGVSCYIVHGNHDPVDGHVSELGWPEGSHFFGRTTESVAAVGRRGAPVATISGISYRTREEGRNLARTFGAVQNGLFQIGLLHTNVDGQAGHGNYAPCTLADLRAARMDYWALGHVHTRSVLGEKPWVVYPGNTQGRSMREQGPRGCYVVRVDEDGEARLEFVALDGVRWTELTIDIEAADTVDALERLLRREIDAAATAAEGRALVCRAQLVGRGRLHAELRREKALEQWLERLREGLAAREPFVWLQRLTARTRPEVDIETRMQRGDLLAEVLTIASEYRTEEGALSRLNEEALGELWGNTRIGRAQLPPPSGEELAAVLREAELLCLDHLEGEE